jgi:tungstate transport system substrate-binding protein
MRAGKVDLLTMHSGDITTDLVADGYGTDMRPWTRNELCIVGPPDDPAHVRGMTNGVAALKKIAAAKAHFVDF